MKNMLPNIDQAYDMDIDFTGPYSVSLMTRITKTSDGFVHLKIQEFSNSCLFTVSEMISSTPLPDDIKPFVDNSAPFIILKNDVPIVSYITIQNDGLLRIIGDYVFGENSGICGQTIEWNSVVAF